MICSYAESQNWREGEVGRDLLKLFSSYPSASMSSQVSDASKDGNSTTSEQPVAMLCHLWSKNAFPDVQMKFLIFQFVSTAAFALTGYHHKSEYSFHLPSRCLYTLLRFTLSFLQAELFCFCPSMTDVSKSELSALDKLSPCCSFTRRSRAGPSSPDASLVLTAKAGFTSLSLLAVFYLLQPRMLLSLWCKGLLLTCSSNLAKMFVTISLDKLLLCLCSQFPSSSPCQSKPVWQHCDHFWHLCHCSPSSGCGVCWSPCGLTQPRRKHFGHF